MKKTFMCSLCCNGILGGALYVDENSIAFKTTKLTVAEKYRNLVMPRKNIEKITWKIIVFPVATIHISNGDKYSFIIYNKEGFIKYLEK